MFQIPMTSFKTQVSSVEEHYAESSACTRSLANSSFGGRHPRHEDTLLISQLIHYKLFFPPQILCWSKQLSMTRSVLPTRQEVLKFITTFVFARWKASMTLTSLTWCAHMLINYDNHKLYDMTTDWNMCSLSALNHCTQFQDQIVLIYQ